jgi:tetratricopeptide (TPR) repeat protein
VARRAGNLAGTIGDLPRARFNWARAIDLGRARGDGRRLGRALCSMSDLSFRSGEHGLARSQLEEALSLATETGDADFVPEARTWLAWLARRQGRVAEARALANAVVDEAAKCRRLVGSEGAIAIETPSLRRAQFGRS